MPAPYQTPTPYINPAILTSAATGILPGLMEHYPEPAGDPR